MVGKREGGGSVLLVLSERQRREEIIFKMPQKTQESVKEKLDYLELLHGEGFKEKFKSITVDNGSEFLDFDSLEKSFLTPEIQRVTVEDIQRIEHWINSYPRRIFGYRSANDMAA